MRRNPKILGNWGEQMAAEYLRGAGYRIREAQYRTPLGEIDLIAEKDGAIIFAEVKTRRSSFFGTPAQAVNWRKQQKILRTATCYVQDHQLEDRLCRFDVIEVYREPSGRARLQHFEGAFEA